jgi:hypothetical protein
MKWVLRSILILALLAILIPSVLRARRSPGVQGGLGEIRTLLSAENAYASANGGYFDSPSCLAAPATCLPGVPGGIQAFLDRDMAEMGPHGGYSFRFCAGPAPVLQESRGKVSKGSMMAFAVVALPLEGSGQYKAFCGDSTGRVCARGDGIMPVVESGHCPEACETLR